MFKNNCGNYSGSNNLKMKIKSKQWITEKQQQYLFMMAADVSNRDTHLIKYENNLQYRNLFEGI